MCIASKRSLLQKLSVWWFNWFVKLLNLVLFNSMISPRPRKETIWESSLLCCWICLKWVPCTIIVKSFFCYQFCVPLTLQQCRMTRKQPEIGHIYLGRSTKLNQALPFQRCVLVCVLVCILEEANVWREKWVIWRCDVTCDIKLPLVHFFLPKHFLKTRFLLILFHNYIYIWNPRTSDSSRSASCTPG